MRAVRSDVFRETHQSSRSRDKIGQGKVYYRDTECITKLCLGSRMNDADKKKIEEALAQLARQVRLPEGFVPTRRYAGVPHCINTAMRHTRGLTDEQWKTLDPLIPKPRRRRDGRHLKKILGGQITWLFIPKASLMTATLSGFQA